MFSLLHADSYLDRKCFRSAVSLGRERSWAALFCNALIQLTFSTSHKEYIKRQILFVSDSKILPCEHVCRIKGRNWLRLLTVIVSVFFCCVFFFLFSGTVGTELFVWLLLIIVRTAIEGKESKRLSLHFCPICISQSKLCGRSF